jgi:hypothetical protein
VTARSSATITGTDPNNKTESESLRVVPSFLEKIALSPESVVGGSPSTATLTLSGAAPTGGACDYCLEQLSRCPGAQFGNRSGRDQHRDV